jgi:adenylyltransferase/sulfurtransferase
MSQHVGPVGEEQEAFIADEQVRYSRHLMLPEVGLSGQAKLKRSSVLLVGLGGLGSPLAVYLAAAGIGRIGLVDGDFVELSNLQRQIVHTTDRIGVSKVQSAATAIRAVNPHVVVDCHRAFFTPENAISLGREYDLIIDGTDNFATRYLVNDLCVLLGKPNCYGSIYRFEGQASVWGYRGGPCYRCLFPVPPPVGLIPSCADAGVLGVLPGLVGTIQATEAIKILLEIGETLSGKLLLIDSLSMQFRKLSIRRNPNCPVCGDRPTISGIEPDNYRFDACPESGVREEGVISVEKLRTMREQADPLFLLDVRESFEYKICNLGGLLIPIGELEERLGELPRDRLIVVHCKSGVRGRRAVNLLRQRGFEKVLNLEGGILQWIESFDDGMQAY